MHIMSLLRLSSSRYYMDMNKHIDKVKSFKETRYVKYQMLDRIHQLEGENPKAVSSYSSHEFFSLAVVQIVYQPFILFE